MFRTHVYNSHILSILYIIGAIFVGYWIIKLAIILAAVAHDELKDSPLGVIAGVAILALAGWAIVTWIL
jgi:hypothetical protein